ncbi:MAG: SMI1/KNR4 family protein [Zoogloeaceae bacterium]|jgi:hypothetical protein|nr:SMI1/KNR4 family protein [Zoogloeaceae bacterium]
MVKFSRLGMAQAQIDALSKRGITYDKTTKKQLLCAYDFSEKPSHGDVERFEITNTLKLPGDYATFLMKYNGGYPDPDTITVKSGFEIVIKRFNAMVTPLVSARLETNYHAYQGRIPKGFLPIACSVSGDILLLFHFQI